jgi:hypothetical protein
LEIVYSLLKSVEIRMNQAIVHSEKWEPKNERQHQWGS